MYKGLIFVLASCIFINSIVKARQLTINRCEPQGVKLSLGDNYDKSIFLNKNKPTQSVPHDYTISYFTESNCTSNYVIVYTNDNQNIKLNPIITFFRQEQDNSGLQGTTTRTEPFEIYFYEFQLQVNSKQLDGDQMISYSCFYLENQSSIVEEKYKGRFQFYHPDNSNLKSREFKLLWISDFDVNESKVAKYNKRRFGLDNMKIIKNYIDQNRDKFISLIGGGDYAYDLNDDSGQRGANFFKQAEFLFSSIPFVTVAGNHELWYDMQYYKAMFRNPSYSKTQSDYYTLDFGDLIMIGLNTNRFVIDQNNKIKGLQQPYFNQMLDWLNKTLEWANQNYQWVIVFSHQNIHCFDDIYDGYCYNHQEIITPLEDVMMKHKVDIYLGAHIHAYERVHPLYKGKIQFEEGENCQGKKCNLYKSPTAPVYITDGTAGTNHYFPMDSGYPGSDQFTVTSDRSLGFSTITVKNKTHLLFEHYLSDTMKLFDYFYIQKPYSQNGDSLIESENNQTHKYIYITIFGVLFIIAIFLIFLLLKRRKNETKSNILKNESCQVNQVPYIQSTENNAYNLELELYQNNK